MIPLTPATLDQAGLTVKSPNLVLCIDGADICYGSASIKKLIRIGDPDLFINDDWVIGGFSLVENQETLLSLSGSTQSIKQQIDFDKGRGSSIQSMDLELVDLRGLATDLITPGKIVEDILGRKCKVYLALESSLSAFPEDYILLFRGIVDDIKAFPASVVLTVSHPEQKKKQSIYPRIESDLNGAINASQATITLSSTTGLLLPATGPDGNLDTNFKSYIRVNDELIEYTGISGNDLTGCVRGSLFTFAASHGDGDEVVSFYRMRDVAMIMALKVMMSKQGPYAEAVPLSAFNVIPGLGTIANNIFTTNRDLIRDLGITVGDYVTITGAANGANNVTLAEIFSIEASDIGVYMEIGGVSFVDESPTDAVFSVRSKYDSYPQGLGLGGDEVDVDQHELIHRRFLSSFQYDIYVKDTIENGREFLDQDVYRPASCYSVPRKAKASVQYLIGPVPGERIAVLNYRNIEKPSTIRLRRSLGKNFYNTIIYRYDEDELEEDKFVRGRITTNATSLAQIPVGTRPLVIDAKGLREIDLGGPLAASASNRRLNRYAFGAEYFEGIRLTLGAGFEIEVGDVVLVEFENLKVANTVDANREKPTALFEVQNKTLNYKSGEVQIDIVNTSFDPAAKYGLISPSSRIRSVSSTTRFVIEETFNSPYGTAEFQKWRRFLGAQVLIRSPDYTTRYAVVTLLSASSNSIVVDPALPFTPDPGDFMEFSKFDVQDSDAVKLVYVHMSPLDGGTVDPYLML